MASPFTPLSPNRVARRGRQPVQALVQVPDGVQGVASAMGGDDTGSQSPDRSEQGTDDAIADPNEIGVEACRDIAVLLGALTG